MGEEPSHDERERAQGEPEEHNQEQMAGHGNEPTPEQTQTQRQTQELAQGQPEDYRSGVAGEPQPEPDLRGDARASALIPVVPGVQPSRSPRARATRPNPGLGTATAGAATPSRILPGGQSGASATVLDDGSPVLHREDQSGSPNDCLCLLTGYLTQRDVSWFDSFTDTWSIATQQQAVDFVLANKPIFKNLATEQSAAGSRKLCSPHLHHLAKLIGLRVAEADYGVLLKRFAAIANSVNSYTEFDEIMLRQETTRPWFRNRAVAGANKRSTQNMLHPFRFRPLRKSEDILHDFREKVLANGDRILSDALSWIGIDVTEPISIEERGFLDIPQVFKWLFDEKDNSPSIATMADHCMS